jgi:multidrug efflux pump subunit AcrB
MGGVVGLLFREFAVTVAVSIAISLVVSLTLTPMMCAHLLKPESNVNPGYVGRVLQRFFNGLLTVYDRAWVVGLRHRQITLMIMVLTVCATVALFVWIPKGFFPQQDTGTIVGISEGAQDISPQAMMERQAAILEVVTKDPAVPRRPHISDPAARPSPKTTDACLSRSNRAGRGRPPPTR